MLRGKEVIRLRSRPTQLNFGCGHVISARWEQPNFRSHDIIHSDHYKKIDEPSLGGISVSFATKTGVRRCLSTLLELRLFPR